MNLFAGIQALLIQGESQQGGIAMFFHKVYMTIVGFYQTWIYDALKNSLNDYGEILKNLLIMILIVIIAWIVAKIAQIIIRSLLRIINFDKFSDKTGFTKFLEHGGLHNIPSTTIANIFYWILLFIGFTVAINISSQNEAPVVVKRLFSYISEGLLALLVFILGLAIGVFLSKILKIALIRAGLNGKIVSFLSLFLILIFSVKSLLISLSILMVDERVIGAVINNIIEYSFLGLAIAFALGGRHLASDIVSSFKLRKLYPKGVEVSYDEVTGVLKEVGWFDSLVYTEKGIINIPNSALARKIIKRKI